ncbi:hypothetical protein [Streptomyces sp. SID7909]|uniref:hypothetical protein n=1 Tax=Streptomyces sp. SID7909 TaxID=2706092 RepID=UPI001EF32FB4|nr:hypothetical protein [Streptomyces sp. SID7909]
MPTYAEYRSGWLRASRSPMTVPNELATSSTLSTPIRALMWSVTSRASSYSRSRVNSPWPSGPCAAKVRPAPRTEIHWSTPPIRTKPDTSIPCGAVMRSFRAWAVRLSRR